MSNIHTAAVAIGGDEQRDQPALVGLPGHNDGTGVVLLISDEAQPSEIAISAMEQLCSRDPNETEFDFLVCVGVVRFLDETCTPAKSENVRHQCLKDLAAILKSPGTAPAYAAWVKGWYR